ncbi:hypothetical protein ACVWYI_000875 [Bradyrhizobium sp. LB13.1]
MPLLALAALLPAGGACLSGAACGLAAVFVKSPAFVEPVGLYLGDTVGQCRDHGSGRGQVEVQDRAAGRRDHQACLLKRSHDVGRHDGGEHVRLVGRGEQSGLLLSVKDDVDRGVLALVEAVAGTRKGQRPYAGSIVTHDKDDAVRVRCRRGAMRESSRFIIAERAADPVTDLDAAERPGRMRCAEDAHLQ